MVDPARCAAILTAAGASTRMGQPKGLLAWGDRPLLVAQVDALLAAGTGRVVIVLGHHRATFAPLLSARSEPALRVVVNPDPDAGRASSVRCGVAALAGDEVAILVVALDQPLVAAESPPGTVPPAVAALFAAFDPVRSAYAVPASDGRTGHPALFAGRLARELGAVEEAHQGLRAVTTAHRDARQVVEVPGWPVGLDLNTPEDYAAAIRTGRVP